MSSLEPWLVTTPSARPVPGAASGRSQLEPCQSSVSSAAFRQALSQLAAGTSIVTTRDEDGRLFGMTATAVTSVSLDPPLVLVCVDNRVRTAAVLQAQAPFVVQFLAANQEALARRFASPIADRTESTGLRGELWPEPCTSRHWNPIRGSPPPRSA